MIEFANQESGLHQTETEIDGKETLRGIEFTKLSQEQTASASLRQRAAALAEYLKANPPGAAAPAAAPAQGAKP